MEAAACAVGRLGESGAWIGFAPSLEDAYELVVAVERVRRERAADDDLLALAIAYFEDSLEPPPEELAAMHRDIAALVRHVAERRAGQHGAEAIAEAVDAIDDGLASEVVIARLRSLGEVGFDPAWHLARRAAEMGVRAPRA